MMLRAALSALALSLFSAACAADSNEPVGVPRNQEVANRDDELDRVELNKALIEKYALTADDVASLQLYLHGRIFLRRETTAGAREITKQHTLKVVDGRVYDELVVDSGTPGVSLSLTELKVNFDPDDPEGGFLFTFDPEGHLRLDVTRTPGVRGRPSFAIEYGGEHYEVVEGASCFLDVGAEKLEDIVTTRRKLPGTVLP